MSYPPMSSLKSSERLSMCIQNLMFSYTFFQLKSLKSDALLLELEKMQNFNFFKKTKSNENEFGNLPIFTETILLSKVYYFSTGKRIKCIETLFINKERAISESGVIIITLEKSPNEDFCK